MTLLGKNESPLETFLFFFSHSQFISTHLSLSLFLFSVSNNCLILFVERQDRIETSRDQMLDFDDMHIKLQIEKNDEFVNQ